MINVKDFFDTLISNKTDFFCGIPDSLLKSFCAYVSDHAGGANNIITANEGSAVALASGYHLATSKFPLIYMQNSGLGNAINPLLSLADEMVYSIPMILLIGWRGEPNANFKDEPQHAKQGIVTCDLLDAMKIPYAVLNQDYKNQLRQCYEYLQKNSSPFALVVQKGTFDNYQLQNSKIQNFNLSREKAIEICINNIKDKKAIFISTTGMASRELFELRKHFKMPHHSDFLTVGSMGHSSQIALGIALNKPNRKIICIDGDGAAIMHLGSLATIGSLKPANLLHIVINNAAHDSVGSQPTCADKIDLCAIAKACGYENCVCVDNENDLNKTLQNLQDNKLTFIEIKTKIGNRSNLGRPTTTPQENKAAFMQFLKEQQ